MHPNIPTDACSKRLERWFELPNQLKWFKKLKVGTLMAAIKLVMKGNRMKFGDLFAKQIKGVAMGMSTAHPDCQSLCGYFRRRKCYRKIWPLHRLFEAIHWQQYRAMEAWSWPIDRWSQPDEIQNNNELLRAEIDILTSIPIHDLHGHDHIDWKWQDRDSSLFHTPGPIFVYPSPLLPLTRCSHWLNLWHGSANLSTLHQRKGCG